MLTALTAGLPNTQVTAVQNVVLGLLILGGNGNGKKQQKGHISPRRDDR